MEIILAILSIALIDLVLSGDNAAVIGLAIKNLPEKQRKSAAFIGAGGAIVLRVIFTILATILIRIPYLNAIGGAILFWITWKLLRENEEEEEHHCGASYWSAIWSIIIADLSMAFDNIMGVAGAAHGEVWLVIFGLLLSIPILVIGSSWLAKLMNRFPIIVYIGGAVLLQTAAHMILNDHALRLQEIIGHTNALLISWGLALALFLFGVYHLYFGTEARTRMAAAASKEEELQTTCKEKKKTK